MNDIKDRSANDIIKIKTGRIKKERLFGRSFLFIIESKLNLC